MVGPLVLDQDAAVGDRREFANCVQGSDLRKFPPDITSQARTSMALKLDAGDSFPDITLNLVGGSTLNLPGDLKSNYSIVLFYRGHW